MSRPSIQEYRDFLRRHQALIVHFSGCPKGVGLEIYYPDDLSGVIADSSMGVSASVLKLGDTRRNAFGVVGVILDISRPESIISVKGDDGGSSIDKGTGKRGPRQAVITLDMFEESLVRDLHNEWAVEDFTVKGVLILPDRVVWDRNANCGLGGERGVMFGEVAQTFPTQPLYSINPTFVKRTPNGPVSWVDCTHSDIYGW